MDTTPLSETPSSFAWRGPSGCGKRTQLLSYLERRAKRAGIEFVLRKDTWQLNKPSSCDPDDDELGGKSIPYEVSPLHLGFDVARMSMSDKLFLQSILTRWTGQQDLCLMDSVIKTRYLVLYHAHFLTDESVLQLQECLEQFPTFAILLTTELPICPRLRDFCFEIPVRGPDRLLSQFTESRFYPSDNVWHLFFKRTLEEWSVAEGTADTIIKIRQWIYTCLQRNLRWTDMVMYWLHTVYTTSWLTPSIRQPILEELWKAESGAGWMLVTSYRIPMLWEQVQLTLSRHFYRAKQAYLLLHPNHSTHLTHLTHLTQKDIPSEETQTTIET